MSYLASKFGRNAPELRSEHPLTNDQMRAVAPSIFAEDKHDSRSERYTYIPTITVLDGLRKEGFEPFMVAQTRVRNLDKREHTKHMIRLRRADTIGQAEANEVILLNSHDGASSYQMIGGRYRFVCKNGMVHGDTLGEVRVPHKGDIVGDVIEGAIRVLDTFDQADEQCEGMKALKLDAGMQDAFASAALVLKYDDPETPAPVTESQLLRPKRFADRANDLWTTLNVVQENMIRGGLHGRNANGRNMTTRPVTGIDQNVKLNRALWVLADKMRKILA